MKTKFKEIREKAGFSQFEMADKMHISQSTYARFERQTTKIDLQRTEDFAKAVNMDLIDVLTFPERYINVRDIGKEINHAEPEVVVQIKVFESKREEILRTVFGKDIEVLKT